MYALSIYTLIQDKLSSLTVLRRYENAFHTENTEITDQILANTICP